ncbi:MAG: DNA cytosine methyltransferase [Alphaproteobacteria bacterium]
MKIISLFTGCGGLDLGFKKAGFDTIWMNEYDKTIWNTIRHNFPSSVLDTRSISDIDANDVPNDVVGIIGGPPCQSWSEAGAGRGINDKRGQLFFDFIRMLDAKKPEFFFAENVSGMLHKKHQTAFSNIKSLLANVGYTINQYLVNASDYGVPQDRKRVLLIGFRDDLEINFSKQEPINLSAKKTLKDAIWDLKDTAQPALSKNRANPNLKIPNHEFMTGAFSTIYMSRNRVRSWDEPSFTIQAGGRHAPIHPQAPKMAFVETNKRIFVPGKENLYRRMSVRECARVQCFPDQHVLIYDNIADGYKMIGNAVPVDLAYSLALDIKNVLANTAVKKAS